MRFRVIVNSLIYFFVVNNLFSQQNTIYNNNQNALTDYIEIYQKYISGALSSSCQMYPSCSNYGMICFKNYSPLKALILTSDRMLRCSHDQKFYYQVEINNQYKIWDLPIQNPSLEKQYLTAKKTVLIEDIDTSTNTKFIRYLLSKKLYTEALIEINKQLFDNKGNPNSFMYLNQLVCLRALNRTSEAILEYESYFPDSIKNETGILFEVGNLYLDLNNYNKALEYYYLSQKNKDPIFLDKTNLLIGYTYANLRKWEDSKIYFNNINSQSPFYDFSKNCLTNIAEYQKSKQKKEVLAGVLSIVPGLGYCYSKHYQSGLSSFLVNGLLAFATYSNIKNKNYGMASLTGLFSFSFYLGNISGSIKSTRRYNETLYRSTINKLKLNIYY